MRAFFERHNFTVTLRIANPPDDDVVFMSRAPFFIESGGGFSAMVKRLVHEMGGTALCDGSNAVENNFAGGGC